MTRTAHSTQPHVRTPLCSAPLPSVNPPLTCACAVCVCMRAVPYADLAVEDCSFSIVGQVPVSGAGGEGLWGILAICRAASKAVRLHQRQSFGGIPADQWIAWKDSRVRSLALYIATHCASPQFKAQDGFKLDALAKMGFEDRVRVHCGQHKPSAHAARARGRSDLFSCRAVCVCVGGDRESVEEVQRGRHSNI
jgi:hypothetical protein